MSGATGVAVVLSLASGVAASLQAAVLARFGARIGTYEAVGFSTLVAGVVGVAVILLVVRGVDWVGEGARAPQWLWLGGAFSVFIILSLTIATPRIGVTAAIAMLIGGQLVTAAVIDQFGWFGFERVALAWPRVLGVVLLAAGAALTLRK